MAKRMSEEELRKSAEEIAKEIAKMTRDPDERRWVLDYLRKVISGIEPKLDPAIQHMPAAEVRTGPLQFGDEPPGFYLTSVETEFYEQLFRMIAPDSESQHNWHLDQLARLAHCMRANLTQDESD